MQATIVAAGDLAPADVAHVTAADLVIAADGDEVRRLTGFAIGGVPPFAHATPAVVLVDRDLAQHDTVWAAAGLPDAVFPIGPADLVRVSGGTVADLAESAPTAS